jgi:hypothetical protein
MTARLGRATIVAALLAAAATPAITAAQDAKTLAKAFGAREGIRDISLSPDGSRVAMIVPAGARGAALVIADPLKGGDPVSIMSASGDPDNLLDCGWVTTSRLVCRALRRERMAGRIESFTRIFSIDADGKNMKLVSARATDRSLYFSYNGGGVIDWTGDGKGSILMARDYVPEVTIGSLIASNAQGKGVERVNVETLARAPIERARRDALEYITDGLGTVRIMGILPTAGTGYASQTVNYFYRKLNSKEWEPLGKFSLDASGGTGFKPYAVDPALNVVYGFDDAGGRRGLWRIALDGSLKRELVLANDKVDIDQLLQVGR